MSDNENADNAVMGESSAEVAQEEVIEEPSLAVAEADEDENSPAARAAPTSRPSASAAASKPAPSSSSSQGDVVDLLRWKDVKKSGAVFGTATAFWYAVTFGGFTVVSVLAYVALTVLFVAFAWVQWVMLSAKFIKGKPAENPFVEHFGDRNFQIDRAVVEGASDLIVVNVNRVLASLRTVFFCEDPVVALKWMGIFYAVAKVGTWFSAVTLMYLPVFFLFTWPTIYSMKQKEIDQAFAMAKTEGQKYLDLAISKIPPAIAAKLPLPAKKEKSS